MALIFSIFSSTCLDDHQLKIGFECVLKIISSSKDSTSGAPNVSGSNKVSSADIKLAAPKISKGNCLKVIRGRYNATCNKIENGVTFYLYRRFMF